MNNSWFRRLRSFLSKQVRKRAFAEQSESIDRADSDTHLEPTAQALGFSVSDLNRDAARRQAKLGKGYARSRDTPKRLKELQQGIVTLPPHGAWEGDYTDWTADPFEDRNWRFQFHTLRWINPYLWNALDGDEVSRQEWKRIVHSWAQTNTPPQDAPDDYAWQDMTDGNRAIQISLGAPLINAEDYWYVELLTVHRNWLLNDENIVPGNHGLHQNLGLFVVATVLNDDIGVQRAIDRLGDQVLEAFDEGGLNEEGSVGYHQMNLIWWIDARKRVRLEGKTLPKSAEERLDKAGETLGHLLLPDGALPQIGDGNRGKGRRDLHPLVRQITRGRVTDRDLPTFQHYTNGFTVFRSGWGQDRPLSQESHTIVRHGRELLRHAHNDRGSIHIYSRGRRWVTDGGFHSYQVQDPNRNYTKSRLAHSLLDLPELNHDATGDVPAVLTERTNKLQSIEILDENFDSAEWRRRVVFLPKKNVWVIWDRVVSETPIKVQQQWLIDIGLKVNQSHDAQVILQDKQQQMALQWLGDRPQFDIAKGDISGTSQRGLIGTRWKKMKPGTSIHATFNSKATESIVVIGHDEHEARSVKIEHHNRLESFHLTFSEAAERYTIKFTRDETVLCEDEAL